jgi:abortive infection bacteriophage resistance protein
MLAMLTYLLSVINSASTWRQWIKALIRTTQQRIDVADMGFPADWEQMTIWQEKTA